MRGALSLLLLAVIIAAFSASQASPGAAGSPPPPAMAAARATIAAGTNHTCLVQPSGTVRCWGRNDQGQLGDSTVIDRDVPKPISGEIFATGIAAGTAHTCAIAGGGLVYCWGDGSSGQLGSGANSDLHSPSLVATLGGSAVAVTAGGSHSCALMPDSTMRCWGANLSGQIGDGTHGTNRLSPVPVCASGSGAGCPQLSGVIAITAGAEHTCALLSSSEVRCWGRGEGGQLGNAAPVTCLFSACSPLPVEVCASGSGASCATGGGAPLSAVIRIDAGGNHTCVIDDSGDALCWGRDDLGQLGNGAPNTASATPVSMGISDARAISAGVQHTCAVGLQGDLQCWGRNTSGQLGDATIVSKSAPVAVGDFVLSVVAGGDHTCISQSDSDIDCTGDNAFGQLGDGGAPTDQLTFVSAMDSSGIALRAIANGDRATCALTGLEGPPCWGDNSQGQLGNGDIPNDSLVPTDMGLSMAHGITAGLDHMCALDFDGVVFCWGDNEYGQLGDGLGPVDSGNPGGFGLNALSIDAGWHYNCAVAVSGLVYCWGRGHLGQLGTGVMADAESPTAVCTTGTGGTCAPLTGQIAVAGGQSHSCALSSAGIVRCWGAGGNRNLGHGLAADSLAPVVALGGPYKQVSVGSLHTCALRVDGQVACWGYNAQGQVGSACGGTCDPTVVPGISTAVSVVTGNSHSCALTAGGAVRCWGYNAHGQLGDGTLDNSTTPVTVTNLATATAVFAGHEQTCALFVIGTFRCWGRNFDGQLGDGTTESRSAPVDVLLDSDRDGCTDVQEEGGDEALGGRRDFVEYWDFFDVNDNRNVDLSDTLEILARFGLTPGDEGYDENFDRLIPNPAQPWRTGAAFDSELDAGIDLEDALANIQSFGHSCVPA